MSSTLKKTVQQRQRPITDIARIVVESRWYGSRKTALRYKISPKTVERYRRRVECDEHLKQLVEEMHQEFDTARAEAWVLFLRDRWYEQFSQIKRQDVGNIQIEEALSKLQALYLSRAKRRR